MYSEVPRTKYSPTLNADVCVRCCHSHWRGSITEEAINNQEDRRLGQCTAVGLCHWLSWCWHNQSMNGEASVEWPGWWLHKNKHRHHTHQGGPSCCHLMNTWPEWEAEETRLEYRLRRSKVRRLLLTLKTVSTTAHSKHTNSFRQLSWEHSVDSVV